MSNPVRFLLGLSPNPMLKPVAAPAAHSILKNGNLPQSSYIPPYTVQSPYSTMVTKCLMNCSLPKGRGCGQVVSELTFCSDDPSL